MTRGERNNNPGNLRYNAAISWQGAAATPQDENGYCIFTSASMGLRALAMDLYNAQAKHGRETINTIISAFAPVGDDNDTEAYCAAVALDMKTLPGAVVDLSNADVLFNLTWAIVKHENGRVLYANFEIAEAIASAYRGVKK